MPKKIFFSKLFEIKLLNYFFKKNKKLNSFLRQSMQNIYPFTNNSIHSKIFSAFSLISKS